MSFLASKHKNEIMEISVSCRDADFSIKKRAGFFFVLLNLSKYSQQVSIFIMSDVRLAEIEQNYGNLSILYRDMEISINTLI